MLEEHCATPAGTWCIAPVIVINATFRERNYIFPQLKGKASEGRTKGLIAMVLLCFNL